MSDVPHLPLIAVVGPTAAGKTALSVELAAAFGGEIISADSRQIYRGMDIGTAKATAGERALVPHHLVDIVDPDRVLTAAEYQPLAYADDRRDPPARPPAVLGRWHRPVRAVGARRLGDPGGAAPA